MMSRNRLIHAVLFLAAAILTIQSVVHHHPLAPTDSTTSACSVCAAGTVRLATRTPNVVMPLVVVSELAAIATIAISRGALIALPPRAPPAR